MRVLLVHNHYGSGAPSGENRVFALERDMLLRHGHEVETLERFSDELRDMGMLGAVAGALMTPWNPLAARAMVKAVRHFRPDIVHAHNTFPILSPAIFSAARGTGRVLTLHNYRLVCPAAIPMRDGRTCTACIDEQRVWPALRHGCYRNSRAATLPLALNIAINRHLGTWNREVECFVALSTFQRDLMIRAGLPSNRITIKPNFHPSAPSMTPYCNRPRHAVFVGRLGEEKGVKDLIDAWRRWGADAPKLRIVGDGPLRAELESQAADIRSISFLGQVEPVAAEKEISTARLLILPSRCFEGLPMTLIEAFRAGTPIAVSDIGPLPALAEEVNGIVFRSGDPNDLFKQIAAEWKKPDALNKISINSQKIFKDKYSETNNYKYLLGIYEKAISNIST